MTRTGGTGVSVLSTRSEVRERLKRYLCDQATILCADHGTKEYIIHLSILQEREGWVTSFAPSSLLCPSTPFKFFRPLWGVKKFTILDYEGALGCRYSFCATVARIRIQLGEIVFSCSEEISKVTQPGVAVRSLCTLFYFKKGDSVFLVCIQLELLSTLWSVIIACPHSCQVDWSEVRSGGHNSSLIIYHWAIFLSG